MRQGVIALGTTQEQVLSAIEDATGEELQVMLDWWSSRPVMGDVAGSMLMDGGRHVALCLLSKALTHRSQPDPPSAADPCEHVVVPDHDGSMLEQAYESLSCAGISERGSRIKRPFVYGVDGAGRARYWIATGACLGSWIECHEVVPHERWTEATITYAEALTRLSRPMRYHGIVCKQGRLLWVLTDRLLLIYRVHPAFPYAPSGTRNTAISPARAAPTASPPAPPPREHLSTIPALFVADAPPADLTMIEQEADHIDVCDRDGDLFQRAQATLSAPMIVAINRIECCFDHAGRRWVAIINHGDTGYAPSDAARRSCISCHEVVALNVLAYQWLPPEEHDPRLAPGRIVRFGDGHAVIGPAWLIITYNEPLQPKAYASVQRVRTYTFLSDVLQRDGYIVERVRGAEGWIYRCRQENDRAAKRATRWCRNQLAAIELLEQQLAGQAQRRQARAARRQRAAPAPIHADLPRIEQLSLF